MLPTKNNKTFLLFFHGLDSSNQTSKYACIEREPKFCQTVNYRENFKAIFDIYEDLIEETLREYPRVVGRTFTGQLVCQSLGAQVRSAGTAYRAVYQSK